MFHIFRNSRTATTAKFAGALLILGLIGASTAAADDKLTVTNNSGMPVMVVILDNGKNELGRQRIEKNATGTVSSTKAGVFITKNASYAEAFRWEPPEREPCYVGKVSGFSVTVKCDANKADEAKKVEGAKKAEDSKKAEEKKTVQQGNGQQKAPDLTLNQKKLEDERDAADADLTQVDTEIGKLDPRDVNSKVTLDKLYQRIRKDNETITRTKTILGQETSVIVRTNQNPYNWGKIGKKETDLKAKLEQMARQIFHCLPKPDIWSLGCEHDTNVGGGGK